VPPAGGQREFDKKPEREELRQSINEWIRTGVAADGVIDFDEALCDPANRVKMRVEYQSDWIHPSDAGYQKMAETAAAKIGSQP
jgi:lysophospholipase L1-like esterase